MNLDMQRLADEACTILCRIRVIMDADHENNWIHAIESMIATLDATGRDNAESTEAAMKDVWMTLRSICKGMGSFSDYVVNDRSMSAEFEALTHRLWFLFSTDLNW